MSNFKHFPIDEKCLLGRQITIADVNLDPVTPKKILARKAPLWSWVHVHGAQRRARHKIAENGSFFLKIWYEACH